MAKTCPGRSRLCQRNCSRNRSRLLWQMCFRTDLLMSSVAGQRMGQTVLVSQDPREILCKMGQRSVEGNGFTYLGFNSYKPRLWWGRRSVPQCCNPHSRN